MGNIGWFILGYLVVGLIAIILFSLGIVVIALCKDYKEYKNNQVKDENCDDEADTKCECEHLDSLLEVTDEMTEIIEHSNVYDEKTNYFLAFMKGLLIWPIAIPHGIMTLYRGMNNR